MGGGRIAAAKRALVVMLRSLPAKDSLFQVASFGNACTLFWEEGGRPYNQATLDDATQHVDSMDANYGGTEIRGALQRCFETRKTDRPTSVFVLTDGQAWDLDGVFKEVKDAVARAPVQAYLRVFVLGIGNSASTAMCEGISRVGNGTCMMVGEQEMNFTGKIARMLKAACSPMITNIEVDWGVPSVEADAATDEDDAFVIVSEEEDLRDVEEKGKGKELSLFDETLDPLQMDMQPAPPPPEVVLPPFPPVQQSPFKIRTLNPGNRVHIYAILQGKTVPKTVTLSGLTEDGSEIKLSVPVTLSNLPNTPDSPPAIHALAARKIIQDVEDGQHAISTAAPDDTDLLARTVKACIVRLAKTYSISSSQTSFVAVDIDYPTVDVDYPTVDAHLPTDAPLNADGSPKRPMNAFMIFARSRRPQVSAENQSMRTGDVSKILSQEWKTMSPADRQAYTAQASQLKQGFDAKYPDYVYRRRPNNTRKHRQLAPSTGGTVYGDMDDEAESGFDAEAFLLLPNSAPLAYSDPTLSAPPTCVAVQHCDDAASKETQYLRRQCHSCKTTDPPSWRRSTLNPGKNRMQQMRVI
ncbi:hypothetical protein MSAN_00544700 [Mycena sanguinolenta]|uniref:HMG box domain-containing protein n=1 Tax=Mycena sanguinolenta TaxID=230812 RepID=A0A8H6ZAI4_9AGAR|nr:hypothetical protein MSAN_00544700 [Mycena sanguinolenta]